MMIEPFQVYTPVTFKTCILKLRFLKDKSMNPDNNHEKVLYRIPLQENILSAFLILFYLARILSGVRIIFPFRVWSRNDIFARDYWRLCSNLWNL